MHMSSTCGGAGWMAKGTDVFSMHDDTAACTRLSHVLRGPRRGEFL